MGGWSNRDRLRNLEQGGLRHLAQAPGFIVNKAKAQKEKSFAREHKAGVWWGARQASRMQVSICVYGVEGFPCPLPTWEVTHRHVCSGTPSIDSSGVSVM